MDRNHLNHLLNTCPGVGVEAIHPANGVQLFFYEDFDGPGTGITRAMNQLYPQLNQGIYSGITFISGPANR